MISLPYIENEIKKENEVFILTENNLEETIKKVLSRTNLGEEEKQKIIEIGWDRNTSEKLNKIKKEKIKEQIVFIKGEKEYIGKIDKEIQKINSNIKTIHCYSIQEVENDMKNIVEKYDAILNTIGKISI